MSPASETSIKSATHSLKKIKSFIIISTNKVRNSIKVKEKREDLIDSIIQVNQNNMEFDTMFGYEKFKLNSLML